MERLVEHPEVARPRMESAACKVSLQLTGRRPFVLFIFRSAYDAVTSSSRETWDQAKAKARDNWEATKDKTGEVCWLSELQLGTLALLECIGCAALGRQPRARPGVELAVQACTSCLLSSNGSSSPCLKICPADLGRRLSRRLGQLDERPRLHRRQLEGCPEAGGALLARHQGCVVWYADYDSILAGACLELLGWKAAVA